MAPPVIFLTFANERSHPLGYLSRLPEEAERLRETLDRLEQAGRCQVLLYQNVRLRQILRVFQDSRYRDRVTIFHYGGHANGYGLLLEAAGGETLLADAKGLAGFLGEQKGLRLLFLNGCSTQAQVEGLLAAGVPVVIATAQAIRDDVATEFAGVFYQGLAGGATLAMAYREAENAIKAQHGSGSPRGLYWAEATDAWPWTLHEREPGAAEWRLPAFPLPPDPQVRLEALPLDHVPDPATLPPGSRLPYPLNPLFAGRKEELTRLARLLKGGQVAAVLGLGGIGKSQLAIQFAHCYGQYFAGGVFWLSLEKAEDIPAQVALCGGAGGMALSETFNQLSLEDQVQAVQAAWQSELPRLLIFDNCESEALLAQWRPSTGGCRVLVTSRRGHWSPGLGVQPLRLEVLPRAESVALLLRHLGYQETVESSAASPDEASSETHHSGKPSAVLGDIAEELGDLPLALHLAGSFLARYRQTTPPAAYLVQLRQKALLAHPSLQGRGAGWSPTGHELHLARTFALSYDRLDPAAETDRLAQTLLVHAAHLASGQPIPHALLLSTLKPGSSEQPHRGIWNTIRTLFQRSKEKLAAPPENYLAEDALARLIELGLLEDELKTASLSLHRLLAGFALSQPGAAKAQVAVEEYLLAEARRLNGAGDPRPLLAWQSHLRAVTEAALSREDKQAANLGNELGYYLWVIGDYTGARLYYERALTIREKVLGPEHPATATSLNNLGALLDSMGDYAEARPYYERALAICEKVLGPEHPDTARSLNNLGALLDSMGDYARARPYYERALAIREAVLGPEHPATATSLNNLGYLLQEMGDYAGARLYYERVLAIREQVLGLEHPYTALSLNNLGYLLQEMGDYAGARSYYEQALAIREAVLGPEHPDTALSLNNLAVLSAYEEQFSEAISLMRRVIAIQEAKLGPEHPDTQSSRESLAAIEAVSREG